MTYSPVDVVEVCAWGKTIGAVALDPATGYYAFEYDTDWVRQGSELAPLQMPNHAGVFVFPELNRQTYYGLPALLADALPDRFGNALVNRWMAENGVPVNAISALDRLAYASDRAMGALEFRPPAGAPSPDATAVQLADLVVAARSNVAGDLTTTDDTQEALRQLIQVGTSAGGARAKAVIAFNSETGQVRSGHESATTGFDQWIVKLDGVTGNGRSGDLDSDAQGFGKIEYAYHLMALAGGIEMSESRLLPEGPRTHFLTKRFDRDQDGSKLHLQSLCALAHLDFNLTGAHSYAQYLEVVNSLGLDAESRNQAFRRMVFNVAALNRDDHTKNLAFLRPNNGEWRLAPAFDLTYSYNPDGQWTAQQQMSVNGKTEGIGISDLRIVGDRFQVPGHNAAIAEVLEAIQRWDEFAQIAGVESNVIAAITKDLARHRPQ